MSTTVVRYNPNFGYGTSNPASIPLKQYIQNGVVRVSRGMPMKPRFADNSSTFAQGRNKFVKTPNCSIYLKDKNNPINCNTGVIRVDGTNDCNQINIVEPQIINGNISLTDKSQLDNQARTWSRSNHTIHNRRRNQLGCSGSAVNTCLLNGKQNIVMTADELINRKKNKSIGRGSSGLQNKDGSKSYELSFNSNNLNGSHTNNLVVSSAKRRTRNSGYVVPPKCRGHASGPRGPFGALQNQGTGFDYSSGINPIPKNMCGTRGWPVTPLLG